MSARGNDRRYFRRQRRDCRKGGHRFVTRASEQFRFGDTIFEVDFRFQCACGERSVPDPWAASDPNRWPRRVREAVPS